MKRLKPMDAAWLYVDTANTPMHVAGLQIFSLPEDAPEDFLRNLSEEARASRSFAPPWNLRLKPSPLRGVLPAWERDDDLDIDYHFRHSALPAPGGERELGVLISRLHSHPMDVSRPLWECHLIEGLEGGRFALYTKMHHALVDGVGGMRMVQRAMSTDPSAPFRPPWSVGADYGKKRDTGTASSAALATPSLRGFASGIPSATRALVNSYRAGSSDGDPQVAPFDAPRSVLNKRISAQRRFATQQYDMRRLKKVAEGCGGTINDVVLAICAGSLRRYLKEANQLPRRSLTAGIPVSIRPQDDVAVGTAISFIISSLATDIADPRKRLEAIVASTDRAKKHLQALPKEALDQYTMLLMGPYIWQLLMHLGGRTPPMFNLAISNVPGPKETLYIGGARLEAMYPVSLVSHGQGLNITCVSYVDTLNFGFTGCRDTLPSMQRLAVYTSEALDELERLCG
ncbi:wax ester/triacylglycerol synthase family O-acyltransferase [Algiphilus sp. NNCM1]|uniref:WS/DGAT/MGAT family O-acyltransferase n=1 Tax=Algiphilus sp. TaxID=1872431 RepID=UPI001CA73EAB|nr:wax ester/triacylglycerol synthase family O-acyltransferase [Algiphilus sp.]MBY8964253.1 wax ester/triacylglycerol synthase family O-acyltransferase [Algiphilus acroporae]MCI5062863.1 wax ester/triacylglycerol synthase family O-acyltransferase [Algiphilus sp.]MCI5102296.1 wax ester/triacylglycerol synthase family O-acyltransferase [Algiphilus sp.]